MTARSPSEAARSGEDWTLNANAPHGLVFDLDNTLFDRQAAFLRVADTFYREHIRFTTAATREDAVGMMVQWDDDGYSDRQVMFAHWLSQWPEVGLDMDSLQQWYRSEMDRQVAPNVEVNAFLAELNEMRVPWGIVTNGRHHQHSKCRAAGLDRLAPFVIVSQDVGYKKPDARIFRDALEATGLTTPSQVMFVGDNPVADIDGAKRFGMQTAWIRRGRQYPVGLEPPDHTVDHVTEVHRIVWSEGRNAH